jgi:HEAT repeat protein
MRCVLRVKGGKKSERVAAIEALSTIKTEAGTTALKSAASEQPEPLNYLAADKLIERGDLSQLPLAERALQKSFDIRIEEEGYSLSTGWNSIEEISDRRAIPTLAKLVLAPDVRTRQAALRALGHTKDAAAILPLFKGLEDGDANVRWYAVMGLAELAGEDDEGGAWYPDFKTFETNESLYVTHWETWAASRQIAPAPENN